MKHAYLFPLFLFIATTFFPTDALEAIELKCQLYAVDNNEVCTLCVDGVKVRRAEPRALNIIGKRGKIGGKVTLVLYDGNDDIIAKAKVPFFDRRRADLSRVDVAKVCKWKTPTTTTSTVTPPSSTTMNDLEDLCKGAEIDCGPFLSNSRRGGFSWARAGAYIIQQASSRLCGGGRGTVQVVDVTPPQYVTESSWDNLCVFVRQAYASMMEKPHETLHTGLAEAFKLCR